IMCHGPQRTQNLDADSRRAFHRVHYGSKIDPANRFHGLAVTYPQDIRNCTQCHASNAAQGDQWKKNPSRLACGSCHDYVEFGTSTAPTCTDPPTLDSTSGLPVKCKHVGGVQNDDTTCGNSGCHTDTKIADKHQPVLRPDPNNAWLVSGGNTRTNAAWLAAAGYVPTGAAKITYEIDSVKAVDDSAIAPNKRLQITFKLKKDGTDVVFQTASSTVTEMIQGFVGSPSIYFAFAVPQDGNNKPADFNATANAYLKSIWDGSATGSSAGTMTGPDTNGFYTVTLTGRQIPPTATMLTGGLGYTYQLTTTPPLTQIDLAAYPYDTNGKKQGGLIVAALNVWKVADGFTGRRAIVENARCNNCHGQLGVTPSYHAGQRNDAPTCSFCHVPDRASSGWAAGSRYFIHAIHAGRKRFTPYTFHAASATANFSEVEFPSPLNDCKVCHLPNTYDFTASASLAAVPNLQLTTVANGTYDSNPANNSSYYTLSPYVIADGVTNYGARFSYNSATGSTTQAASSTLVMSPITTVCSACHDTPSAIMHMKNNGGQFYAQRSAVLAAGQTEGCMLCHGPGRIAAIGAVHQQ
ncbi:MAG: OmcA/MtrC family decaheme c-type cytochrome, partial [Myxococcales bacterium]|nr:OmcA/MtrC family decaheme c-type cytochrome [Myxococcales bacterium]